MDLHMSVCVQFGLTLIILMNIGTILGIEREYFIAVEEVNWNFAPIGSNEQNPGNSMVAEEFIKLVNNRIGGAYKKAVFKHYTDGTYTIPWPKQYVHRGLNGPIIRGEVGDVLKIQFKNKAGRAYSMHSGGVSYLKDSEGTLYVDGTSGSMKGDDFVSPGETHTYTWLVDENSSPSPSDPACIPWIYRSFVNGPRDAESGLVGILLTCKKGTLKADHTRNDVGHEVIVLSKAFDENKSWYIDDNMRKCGASNECVKLLAEEDSGFIESNTMRSINGKSFANLRGRPVCAGDNIAIYFLSLGSEKDTNTMFVEGQVLDVNNARTSNVPVFPGKAVVGMMTPRNPGVFRLASMAEDNYLVGMSAFLVVMNCMKPNAKLPIATNERQYNLSIEEYDWNYGPSGVDQLTNKSLTDPSSRSRMFFDNRQLNHIGGVYKKARFTQYTRRSYREVIPRSPEEEYLGVLGPVIRVEVGEDLKVILYNKGGTAAHSFVGQSLHHAASDSGYPGRAALSILGPGQWHAYNYRVPENIVQAHDPDCVVRLYYSAGEYERDVNSGLIGPLLICRKGTLDNQNKPIKKTSEYILLLKSFDESKSLHFSENIKKARDPGSVNKQDELFKLSNIRSSINGYSYGNLPVINMCKDQETVLHLMTLGTSADDVVLHFQGNTFSDANTNKDSVGLISGMTKTIKMTPNNEGIWAIISTVNGHYSAGMTARYAVKDCITGRTEAPNHHQLQIPDRVYSIAATEVFWDYAKNEADIFTGTDLNDPRANGNIYIKSDRGFIGDMYKKVIYRGFSGPNFTTPIERVADVSHLGLLGPIIKAEVGETIDIYFKNMVNGTRKFSIQPHGVKLHKRDEEYFYSDGQRIESKHGLAFDQTKIYRWTIPTSAGPGPDDPNCITWLYYSAVDRVRDPESGLIGPIQICRKGILDKDGRRIDVDREFHLLFKKFDENLSWYLEDNIRNFAPDRLQTSYVTDKTFAESNNMFGINGESFGNLKGLQMQEGEKVAWNFYSLGDKDDLNTIHFHGNTFSRTRQQNSRADTLELFPGTSDSVEMIAKNAGKWLIHSDMADHMTKGMTALYDVKSPELQNKTLSNI